MHLSLWEKQSFYAPADILIIGSGFVGLWSAYFLKKKKPEVKITLVDRGVIPTGASTRNAGFACFGSVTELMRDAVQMGEESMLTLVEMRYKGLKRIQKEFRKKEIDFATCGGYELISDPDTARYTDLSQQVKWLNHLLAPVVKTKKTFRFSDNKMDKFGFAGISHIISNELEGYLHPGKLCQALLQRVQAMGVNVLPATGVSSIEQHAGGIRLVTDRNIMLSSERLLVCTNGFAKELLPDLEVVPARGQVIVTSPIPDLKIKGTFHYDEGYYYFRNVGNRLLLGGARNIAIDEETTTDMELSQKIQNALEAFLSTHLLPGIDYEITDRWSGIMGVGTGKMPIVKKISDNMYCAVKMSGMGVALAPIAGETVADLMLA